MLSIVIYIFYIEIHENKQKRIDKCLPLCNCILSVEWVTIAGVLNLNQ